SPQRCRLKWGALLTPASMSAALLTPALPFAAPSSAVSLAPISGLGAHQVRITVAIISIRPPQNRADDGAPGFGAKRKAPVAGLERWIPEALEVSGLTHPSVNSVPKTLASPRVAFGMPIVNFGLGAGARGTAGAAQVWAYEPRKLVAHFCAVC